VLPAPEHAPTRTASRRGRHAGRPVRRRTARRGRLRSAGSVQPPEPRIAHLDHHPASAPHRSGQGTTTPRYPLAGGVPTPTRGTSRSHVTPLARSSPSPTLSGEFLTGISPVAPPPSVEAYIVRLHVISGWFVQTKDLVVNPQIFPGVLVQNDTSLLVFYSCNL
jgi:hypothetical protein